MHTGLKALTRRTLLGAITLALGANIASAEYLFGFSNAAETVKNNLTVDESIVLYSGENQGWWSGTFPNSPTNFNYYVGLATELDGDDNVIADHRLNNFFIFDISELIAPVTSAVLNLQFFTGFSATGWVTYTLFDVSTDLALLNTHNGTDSVIYDDLGNGKSYGSFSVSTNLGELDVVQLTLNSTGLVDLNAAIAGDARLFAVGGTLFPPPAPEQQNSVPDSGNTLVLFALAAAGTWSIRNRKKAV